MRFVGPTVNKARLGGRVSGVVYPKPAHADTHKRGPSLVYAKSNSNRVGIKMVIYRLVY